MEQQGQDSCNCPICLDRLKDPVTIGCGHSYCMKCISDNWDNEDWRGGYRCPQCRMTFTKRPVLVKSYVIADLMAELNQMDLPPATDDLCAGPEHVACDFCTKKPCRALMSCIGCSASYCENHLQNIYNNSNHQPQSKKQDMMEPFKKPQENICSRHNEEKNVIRHTDQQCMCRHCAAEEYKIAAGKTKRRKELSVLRKQLQKRLQDLEEDMQILPNTEKVFNDDADDTVKKSKDIFTEVVERVEKVRSEVKNKIRSQQKSEVKQVKDLQGKLKQEITELKTKDDELKQLSVEEDHTEFLRKYPKLPPPSESTNPIITIRPLKYFNDVTPAVSQGRCRLQDVLKEIDPFI